MMLCSADTLTKMFLFSRWLSTWFADSHPDNKTQDWYKAKLLHFEEVVLPNYIENGTYDNAFLFLTKKSEA